MLLDINKSQFGTPAVGYNHEYIDSFDSCCEVEYREKGTRNEQVYTDDYDPKKTFVLIQGKRELDMFNHVQCMTLWITYRNRDENSYMYANLYGYYGCKLNFKVLRSPKRSDSEKFNNHILFNDIIFKTPTELLAYIMEQYFGAEVELKPHYQYGGGSSTHSKKYVYIKAGE